MNQNTHFQFHFEMYSLHCEYFRLHKHIHNPKIIIIIICHLIWSRTKFNNSFRQKPKKESEWSEQENDKMLNEEEEEEKIVN